jgi:hypothetical protein
MNSNIGNGRRQQDRNATGTRSLKVVKNYCCRVDWGGAKDRSSTKNVGDSFTGRRFYVAALASRDAGPVLDNRPFPILLFTPKPPDND